MPMTTRTTTDQRMSYHSGISGLSLARITVSSEFVIGSVDESGDETDQRQGLGERDTQEHGGPDLAGHLGLARHALDRLADQDADAHARADRRQAVADGLEAGEAGLGLHRTVLGDEVEGLLHNAHLISIPFFSASAPDRSPSRGSIGRSVLFGV